MCQKTWLAVFAVIRAGVTLVVMAGVLAIVGCSPAVEETGAKPALLAEEKTYVVVILFDMSGSYARLMAEDGKGYQITTQVLDHYFKDRLGAGNDRVILGQLSGAGKHTLLWEGSPLELRQKFHSAAAMRDFLVENSDSGGSRIYDGIRDGLERLINYPGVAEGRTRSLLVVASDMEDNASGDPMSLNYLLGSLHTYAKINGSAVFLYVEDRLVGTWERNLKACDFKPGHCALYSRIVEKADLPKFSDD